MSKMTGTISFVEVTCCATTSQPPSIRMQYLVFPRKGPRAKSYKPPFVGWPRLSKTVGLTICLTEIFCTSSVLKKPKLTEVISAPMGCDMFIFSWLLKARALSDNEEASAGSC